MINGSSIKASEFNHIPVLGKVLMESTKNLNPSMLNGGLMIDATLGGGGHSALMLEAHQYLSSIGLDQDPNARKAARENLIKFGNRIEIVNTNFADYEPSRKAVLIVADLGVSSPQLDIAERGFSFKLNGPLDMRMNPRQEKTAADIIDSLNEKELADLIYNYGEERFSRRIARKIKKDLIEKGKYSDTTELAYAIAGCYPSKRRYGRIHPATKTFQALRIEVNNELKNLEKFLNIAPNWLVKDGILFIISFHSLEDRLVKVAFQNDSRLEKVNRKPFIADEIEISSNPRSRSAKCRIAKKII